MCRCGKKCTLQVQRDETCVSQELGMGNGIIMFCNKDISNIFCSVELSRTINAPLTNVAAITLGQIMKGHDAHERRSRRPAARIRAKVSFQLVPTRITQNVPCLPEFSKTSRDQLCDERGLKQIFGRRTLRACSVQICAHLRV